MTNHSFKQTTGGFVKSLIAFAGVLISLMTISTAAHAQFGPPTDSFRALNISGLERFQGKNLTVIYAAASPAVLGTGSAIEYTVSEIRNIVPQSISQVAMSLPAAEIPRIGGTITNTVFVVVHEQPHFVWTFNGTPVDPRGLLPTEINKQALLVLAFQARDLARLAAEQGNPAVLAIQLP